MNSTLQVTTSQAQNLILLNREMIKLKCTKLGILRILTLFYHRPLENEKRKDNLETEKKQKGEGGKKRLGEQVKNVSVTVFFLYHLFYFPI